MRGATLFLAVASAEVFHCYKPSFLQARLELAQNLGYGSVELRCAMVLTTTPGTLVP